MPQTALLFSAQDLTDLLGEAVSAERAEIAERVVWGWLQPVWGVAERPTPLPPDRFSAAVELGAIQVANPAGLSEYQLGGERQKFSTERREQILTRAAAGTDSASSTAPSGRFHPTPAYPDQAW